MEEIELIKNIKLLFKCGGLNLTKFLSNNKEVLETISDCDRKKKVTEQLTNYSSPTEAALGVLWDVEKDMCTFSVKLKEKPGTRRGMLSTLSSIFDPLIISQFTSTIIKQVKFTKTITFKKNFYIRHFFRLICYNK